MVGRVFAIELNQKSAWPASIRQQTVGVPQPGKKWGYVGVQKTSFVVRRGRARPREKRARHEEGIHRVQDVMHRHRDGVNNWETKFLQMKVLKETVYAGGTS